MARTGGSTVIDREAFFASLPQDEFSPLETSLRQSLIDFLNSRRDFAFPLIEWIDRRLGGEISTFRDENGQGELRLIAAGVGGGAEAFLDRLPQDSFLPGEEALRESIFDFLASWKSLALAHAGDLVQGAVVKERCAAFLPPDVRLEEWIERRIGGEVQLKKDPKTGHEVIHLTPAARPIVAAKYEALQKAEVEAKAGKGATVRAPLRESSPAVAGKGASKGVGGKSPQPRKPPVEKEEWLNALPSDQLTPEEADLREVLLNFLRDWPRKRPGNKPLSAPIYFPEVAADPELQKCRAALLPPTVPMRDWIDRRIGGEVELRKDEVGQTEILLRGSKPAVAQAAASVAAAAAPAFGGAASAKGGKAAGKAGGAVAGGKGGIDAFFSKLPGDELTEAELDLRQAVLSIIEARTAEGAPPLLSDVCKDRAVCQARTALMPDEVPLRQWLDRRVGGEFEVFKNERGMSSIRIRGAMPPAEVPPKDDAKERFFEALPVDRFTPDEEKLREALLAFLDGWQSREPPTLSNTAGDADVRRSRSAVLPSGGPVLLKDWIDRRMGGELEVLEREGAVYFGLRGSLDATAISADTRKRPREEPEQPRGKAAAPGRGKEGPGGKAGKGASGEPWWKRPREEAAEKGGKAAPRG
eukprot:CAMPEP_0176147468 /NCGR_PEP_ID=MMETSP0120_2-20121206/75176_1 /TAXON_ID=160619 /ORGANISM="Kryptoperidinium foliaceum, Strain CCMP 1326" /LENGTH=641 /DNA_ID=CAMNT_0017484085 /DNA_START=81 /DNA_END=2003 /DNA_ORIENTATION=-